ncbi:hypothetical protein VNO80_21431 [Phaseolus coccineus]|uniref:Uncharacterized protein n=1 Tax=Phaseolus coccineus TaxID=3886 RepID=A0AAN9QT37_PHACN
MFLVQLDLMTFFKFLLWSVFQLDVMTFFKFLLWSEELKVVRHAIDSIATKASLDTSKRFGEAKKERSVSDTSDSSASTVVGKTKSTPSRSGKHS